MAPRVSAVSEDKWLAAERLATFLDTILTTEPYAFERARAIEELAVRLRRTPQTVRAYLRRYQPHRRVSSLLRDDSGRGPRLMPAQDAIIRAVLEEKYLVREDRSLHECWIVANGRLEAAGQRTVAYNTVKGCLHRHWPEAEIARRRGGRTASRLYLRRGGRLQPSYPLQVCQIDETEIDVLTVDGAGNLLKRLWVIVLVDVLTHVILGFWLWPRSPNREAIGLCLQHAMRPKSTYFQRYGIDAVDVHGRPETIISDRAAWYQALAGDRAVKDFRIDVQARRGEPHVRGVVERLQGVVNQQLRKLKGQTGRSPDHRGDYPSAREACLTFGDIDEAVAIAAFRICNGEMDQKTLRRPDLEWQRLRHLIPDHLLSADWQEVQLAFLPEVQKSLSGKGIRHFALDYWDDRDPRLAGLYQNRFRGRLRVKVNRNDVSHIYPLEPGSGDWVLVPRADGDLRPIAEWELKAERAALRAEASTPWSVRARDREQLDAIGARAQARRRTPRAARVTRRQASDRVASELAAAAPKPREAEIALNRLKVEGSGLGALPETDEVYEAVVWREP